MEDGTVEKPTADMPGRVSSARALYLNVAVLWSGQYHNSHLWRGDVTGARSRPLEGGPGGACSACTGEQNAVVLWSGLCFSSRTRVRSERGQYSKAAGHTSTTGSGFSRLMIIPPSVGASGGLATLWDLNEVEVWLTVSMDHVLAVTGRFLKSGERFVVFNVYAPCDISRQHDLWNALSSRVEALVGQNVCVCGDFNAIRCAEERSVSSTLHQAGIDGFNNFVVNNNLVDLSLRGPPTRGIGVMGGR